MKFENDGGKFLRPALKFDYLRFAIWARYGVSCWYYNLQVLVPQIAPVKPGPMIMTKITYLLCFF